LLITSAGCRATNFATRPLFRARASRLRAKSAKPKQHVLQHDIEEMAAKPRVKKNRKKPVAGSYCALTFESAACGVGSSGREQLKYVHLISQGWKTRLGTLLEGRVE